jgi:hypothetical protein
MRLPTIKVLAELVSSIKPTIADDYRAFEDSDEPSIQLTVGIDDAGDWNYQTGDNSYSGAAYHYPHWAVTAVYRNSNCREVAKEIREELANLMAA